MSGKRKSVSFAEAPEFLKPADENREKQQKRHPPPTPIAPRQQQQLTGKKRKQPTDFEAAHTRAGGAKSQATAGDSRFNVSSMFASHNLPADSEEESASDEGDDFEDDEGDFDEGDDEGDDPNDPFHDALADEESADDLDEGDAAAGEEEVDGKTVKPMSRKKLLRLEERLAQRGVVYLSRIPPFMKPQKLRHLMSQFGELGRVYLTPEDQAVTRRRKKYKGNKAVKFEDGWVEFADKKIAKAVARTLNNTNIGGKKRSYYHDDIWNIRYLKGFKWSHLTERLAYENQVRAQRLTHEVRQARQESNFYLEKVQQAKTMESMRQKKRQRLLQQGASADQLEEVLQPKKARQFKQRVLAADQEE